MRSQLFVPVLERIFDQGNINAVLRSAESMAFQNVHIIENESFRRANRVSKGSDKWLSIQRWKSTRECLNHLKQNGYKICVTHLSENAKAIGEIDFSQKTALLFGSEGYGISTEALDLADENVVIPMKGFTQSYNISVAAAIAMYHARLDRDKKLGESGDLNETQKQELLSHYLLASCNKSMQQIADSLEKKQ